MTDRELMQQALKLALEALERARGALAYVGVGNATENPNLAKSTCSHGVYAIDKAVPIIRKALMSVPDGAEQCVCGEPDTPGTHRTDGPCLAEQQQQSAERVEPVAYVEQSILDWLASDKRGPTAYTKTTLAKRKDGRAQAPLYTSPPPSKPWVGLTDEDIWNSDELMKLNAVMMLPMDYFMRVVRAIETKLKEKNA